METKQERKSAIKKLKHLIYTPKSEIYSFRTRLEVKFKVEFTPNNVEVQEKKFGNIKCDLLIPEITASNRIMIYVHGGSFVGGSRDSWKSFCSVIANATSCKVIVPEFRLAPAHPFPASIDDIEHVLRSVISEEKINAKMNLGMEEDDFFKEFELILAGDGSGGNIAVSTIYRLDARYRAHISKLILFSPILDLAFSKTLGYKKIKDEIITRDDIKAIAAQYAKNDALKDPLVSPLNADGNFFENFPEVYIQTGEREILRIQSEAFAELLSKNNVKYTLDIIDDMMHMFQMADEFLMESHLAVDRIGHYVNKRYEPSIEELRERERLMKENNITVE